MSEQVITFNQDGQVVSQDAPYRGGTVTEGSWATVARDLVAIGWGTLNPGEYCKQLVIDDHGIKMVIGRRQ